MLLAHWRRNSEYTVSNSDRATTLDGGGGARCDDDFALRRRRKKWWLGVGGGGRLSITVWRLLLEAASAADTESHQRPWRGEG